jgi:glucan biosynthesis protein C
MNLPSTRRHDLDWVRVCAFGLLVLYHVGMYYVSWDWHVKSPAAGPAIEPLMLLTAPWRLSLLFLVSGAATAFLVGKSSGGFLGARSWRLLVPLVFGMLVVVPPQVYYELMEKAPSALPGGYGAFWLAYLRAGDLYCQAPGDCIDAPTWNHLWFVAYLWAYTVLLWALLRLAPGRMARIGERLGGLLPRAGLLLWPAVLLVAARMLLSGRFESTHDLVDDWYNHAQYLPLFLLGFWIARADAVWERMCALRWPALWLALAAYAFLAWYFQRYTDTNVPPDALRLLQRGAWGLNQWMAIVAILGFARHFAPGDSLLLRYLTPAVFPVYILHQTVIVVLAHHLKPLGIAPAVEGPLLVLATFGASFAGYELVRRARWLRPLFGLKGLAAGSRWATTSWMASPPR